MQIDDEIINNDNIQGFFISNFNNEKTIKISTAIHIKEWIHDFERVNIIKIYLCHLILFYFLLVFQTLLFHFPMFLKIFFLLFPVLLKS